MTCPECHKSNISKKGFDWRARKRVQQYQCQNCGLVFVPKPQEGGKK